MKKRLEDLYIMQLAGGMLTLQVDILGSNKLLRQHIDTIRTILAQNPELKEDLKFLNALLGQLLTSIETMLNHFDSIAKSSAE